MADFASHRSQALHNEAAARTLLPSFHDWAATAAFYAALHHFECWLFFRSEKHTETVQLPPGVSAHSWRKKYLQQNLNSAYRSYSFLFARSHEARYLSGTPGTPVAGAAPALAQVDAAKAKYCLDNQLHEFKAAIRVDLCDFLHPLNLMPATFDAVLSAYPNVKALTSASRNQIQTKLSPAVAGELIKALTLAGKAPA